jgi:hypothetical protein
MSLIRVNPAEEPPLKGESWWVVHPNNKRCVFDAPIGAITICQKSYRGFREGTVYQIAGNDTNSGWITMANQEEVVQMPYYLFARYFDAEAFVRQTSASFSKNSYQMQQLELFED